MNFNTSLYGGDSSTIIRALQEEFYRVGLEVKNTKIEISEMAKYINNLSLPYHKNYGLIIKFECLEDEFKVFKPFIYDVETILIPKYRDQMSGVDIDTMWHHIDKTKYETYTLFKCTMQFKLGGENFMDFIQAFRKKLLPLYEAVESKKFDNEVEKMLLEEDEYNN